MAKRQSKSRSVGHCKSSTERRIVSPVERAIHMKIKETFAIVARMPEYSRLAENSITTMFVGLVTEYGSRSCVAAIDRIRREESEDRAIVLETNMCLALAFLRKLPEAEKWMTRWRRSLPWQLRMYASMSFSTHAEGKADILAVMRRLVQGIHTPKELFDAHFCLWAVGRDPEDWAYLSSHHVLRLFMHLEENPARIPFTDHDIEILIQYAQFCSGPIVMYQVVGMLERMQKGTVKQAGETALWKSLFRWSRARIESLAALLSKSGYLPQIRRIAADVRDPVEAEEAEPAETL